MMKPHCRGRGGLVTVSRGSGAVPGHLRTLVTVTHTHEFGTAGLTHNLPAVLAGPRRVPLALRQGATMPCSGLSGCKALLKGHLGGGGRRQANPEARAKAIPARAVGAAWIAAIAVAAVCWRRLAGWLAGRLAAAALARAICGWAGRGCLHLHLERSRLHWTLHYYPRPRYRRRRRLPNACDRL